MDISLFRESISQHSSRLKEDAELAAFNKAIITANYYSESVMVEVDGRINLFKEKVKNSSNVTIISEGVKDIGKAIWGAIVKFGKAILDLATRFKIFITGGEKGFLKKLEAIKSRISASESVGIDISVPVLKGENGLAGFPKLMEVISLCACGDIYLASNISSNGVVTWKYDEDKSKRDEMFKELTMTYSMAKSHVEGLDTFKYTYDSGTHGDSFIGLLIEPMRMCNTLVKDFSRKSYTSPDDYDISHIDIKLRDTVKGVASKGLNNQILKELGSTNGNLSGIMETVKWTGVNKAEVVKTLDSSITVIKDVFDKKDGAGAAFKMALKIMIADSARMIKVLNKTHKSKPERLAEIHSIGKSTSVLLNTILKEFASMANSVKVVLYDIVKMMSKQSKKVKPVGLKAHMTDTHTLIAAAMGGDGYVKTK